MSPACTMMLIVDYRERVGVNNFAWSLNVELQSLPQCFSKSTVLGGILDPNLHSPDIS